MATCNYPGENDSDTPDFDNMTRAMVLKWVEQLLTEEAEASSFVIVLTKQS